MTLRCPSCGHGEQIVKDSRPAMLDQIGTIRRRRQCYKCGQRFQTYEITAEVIEALETALAESEQIKAAIRGVMKLETIARVTA